MDDHRTNESMKAGMPCMWGKLNQNSDGVIEDWLPLADHCTDVAFVLLELTRQSGIARALSRAIGRPLDETDRQRLAVLAFLHDLGKCNHGFQAKAAPNRMRTAGHVAEIAALLFDDELQGRFLEAIGYPVLNNWFEGEEDALRLLLASISHHGKPVELDDTQVHLQRDLWGPANNIDPLTEIARLRTTAQSLFPEAFRTAIPMNGGPALQHRFAGLVMLADWLGSNAEHFFPFHHGPRERADFAMEAAQRAIRDIGLNPVQVRNQLSLAPDFEALFGLAPTPLQSALFSVRDSSILIAESDTGSGKTEAALGYFFRLFEKGIVDSLYFALPTRVAAGELYGRILDFAKRAFGPDHPPVVLAVPGYARVDGESPAILPSETRLWHDDRRLHQRARTWSAERPKRFLAAPIAAGTIDQALLATMQVNHAHLRSACLDRALLVVDEVHASDTYMRGLLKALLDHHRSAGGHALLLSATLGSDARTELLRTPGCPYEAPDRKTAEQAVYPALTEGSGRMQGLVDPDARSKQVQLEPIPLLSEPEQLIPELAEAVRAGARVLVVLNTVARVMALFRAIEPHPELASVLFRVAGICCPHHGRFARVDRLLLDQTVTDTMGKTSPHGPALLIGSQTLEQSLDIDADWLVTDLCPMDVLLQRIGRLHRHRRERPAAYVTARCTVLTPEDPSLESFFDNQGRTRPYAGLGRVYPDLAVARLTLEQLEKRTEVEIPQDNRALVEAVTHPDHVQRFNSGLWQRHRSELVATAMAHSQSAQTTLIPWEVAFGDPELRFRALDERIATRLGLEDRRLPLPEPLQSPFGQPLTEISIPGWMAGQSDATELDSPPQVIDEGLRFRYGGQAYRYTRIGLEREDEQQSTD